MLRIKAILILRRNATRDYLDFVALSDKLGAQAAAEAVRSLDNLYPQPNKESPLQQLLVQLADPLPFDLEETRLAEYRRLIPRWRDWNDRPRRVRALRGDPFRPGRRPYTPEKSSVAK